MKSEVLRSPAGARLGHYPVAAGDYIKSGTIRTADRRTACASPTKPTRVLLVEDDAAFALPVMRLLERAAEFEIEHVPQLSAAVERLQHGNLGLVLLDLGLPDSSGLATFRRLRACDQGVPVIVLTGLDDEETALATVQEGAQDYLVKGEIVAPVLLRAMRYAVERARFARSLADERQFTCTLLDGIPDLIYFKDREGHFVRINPALAAIFGLRNAEEAVGRSDFHYSDPAHAQSAFDDEQEIIRTGRPLIGKVEKEMRDDGSATWVLTTKTPWRDGAGRIVGTFGISKDITALKHTEEALRASEERLRRLFESVIDYTYAVTFQDGAPALTSHSGGCAAVTGYSAAEYTGDPELWARMIPEEDRETVIDEFTRTLAGERHGPIEHRIVHKDGSVRWVSNTPLPRRDDEGRVLSCDGVVADITERKRFETELLETNARLEQALAALTRSHEELKSAHLDCIRAEKMQSVGRLAAGVAHEVKNPLSIMLFGLRALADRPSASDPGTAELLEEMGEAVRRANEVVGGLLDFASSEGLVLAPESLNSTVEHALHFVRHLLNQSKVCVQRELGADLPCALIDRRKLEQVLLNLFTNACHAMPSGGVLTVSTSLRRLSSRSSVPVAGSGDSAGGQTAACEDALIIEVRDTGTGIAPEKVSEVFDPFFTTKPTGQGTGLGLSVTKKIIDLHGGTISLRNHDCGGVLVTLTLPCKSAEGATP